jgi:hypothetical protein
MNKGVVTEFDMDSYLLMVSVGGVSGIGAGYPEPGRRRQPGSVANRCVDASHRFHDKVGLVQVNQVAAFFGHDDFAIEVRSSGSMSMG